MKSGHPLKDTGIASPAMLERLRDELSVTTAEEFLHFASHYREALAELLDTTPQAVDRLAATAAASVGADEAAAIGAEPEDAYPYRTGHDAPAAGHDTFRNGG